MSISEKVLSVCSELIGALPEEKQKNYKSLLSYKAVPFIDELHEGLTYLAISCIELGILFSKFEKEEQHEIVVQRMTVGYLFEVYNSICEWIGKPIKIICDNKSFDTGEYIERKKILDTQFSKYISLLKAVRDGSFHTKDTGDKQWVNTTTRLLYRNKIPQILRRHLFEYGYDINVITFQKGIYGCYPGIGGFAAIHPSGKIQPMKDLYYAGTNIIVTPDAV